MKNTDLELETRTCYKCEKVFTSERWMIEDEVSHINLGRAGYGSCMDGSEIDFYICSECLMTFIDTFPTKNRERIHNSGSNLYMDSKDWIRMKDGGFTDEDFEERGMYSPRQIKAYTDRFPKCAHPVSHTYKDGSGGTYCPYGATGLRNFEACEHNTSLECYQCSSFIDKDDENVIKLLSESKDINELKIKLYERLSSTMEDMEQEIIDMFYEDKLF